MPLLHYKQHGNNHWVHKYIHLRINTTWLLFNDFSRSNSFDTSVWLSNSFEDIQLFKRLYNSRISNCGMHRNMCAYWCFNWFINLLSFLNRSLNHFIFTNESLGLCCCFKHHCWLHKASLQEMYKQHGRFIWIEIHSYLGSSRLLEFLCSI